MIARSLGLAIGLTAALAGSAWAATDAGCTAGNATLANAAEQVLTLDEAADFLRLEPARLEEAAARGEVPARQLLGEWRFSRAVLVVWMAGVDRPEDCFLVADRSLPGTALAPDELAEVQGAGHAAAPDPDSFASPLSAAGDDTDESFGEQPVAESAQDVSLRREDILLAAGEATLEPSIFYSVQNGDGVALIPLGGGFLPTESQTKSETAGAVITGRYGLYDNVQLFAAGSLLYDFRKVSTPAGSNSLDQVEFGDVAVGARYGLLKEDLNRPSVILSGVGVIPTNGSNGYGLGGGVAVVKSVDPVALFASGDYLHTFDSEPNFAGEIQADDTITATAGYSFALNDSLALGTAVSGTFAYFGDTADQWDEVYSLRFSLTSLIDTGLYLEPSVAFSLNDENPQVLFGLTMPYTFIP